MVKSIYVAAISLLTVVFLAGCRTPDPAHAPTGSAIKLVDLSGTLKLIDGTPVPGADITIQCGTMKGTVSETTTTDSNGAFVVAKVPEGDCSFFSKRADLLQGVRVSRSLMGDVPRVALEVPPHLRLVLSGYGRRWVVDWPITERTLSVGMVRGRSRMPTHTLRIDQARKSLVVQSYGCSTCKPKLIELRAGVKIPLSITNQKIDYMVVEEVKRIASMPTVLRPPARSGAIFEQHITTQDFRASKLQPANRRLLLLTRCDPKAELLDELNHLAGTYRQSGLKVSVVQTTLCPQFDSPSILFLPTKADKSSSYDAYLALEAGWALGAQPGDVVIINRDGKVVFRQAADKTNAMGTTTFDDVVSFLDRTWPPFAAQRRISVTKAASVKTAEAVRLTEQVDAQLKANRFPEAHRLLDRLVQLTPDLAEARKLRALVRARLGDYTGAMQEVAWWRTSFGSESAEELEDQVKQASKGRLGALRVTR